MYLNFLFSGWRGLHMVLTHNCIVDAASVRMHAFTLRGLSGREDGIRSGSGI